MTALQLTNTLTRKVETFEPLVAGRVGVYLCGPTVYDLAHLGNARSAVNFDVLHRLLRHDFGVENVMFVRNITDVDDKIIAKANETGKPISEITAASTQDYLDDLDSLNVLPVTDMPRATQYIAEMIEMIEVLIEKGHAYVADDGNVLFHVPSMKNYGALSRRSQDDIIAGARVEISSSKKDPSDFVLWKPKKPEEPESAAFDSPWGWGRPGWHIECSAMAKSILGDVFDIHAGGNDLIFPHHENEIAQSCCANDSNQMARTWLHNGMLMVEGQKMSKSLGNFFTVRDLLDQGVPGEVIRLVMLGTHYRKPMDWTEKKRQEAESFLNKIAEFIGLPIFHLPMVGRNPRPSQEIVDALSDDLNTSLALTILRRQLKQMDLGGVLSSLHLLGFCPDAIKSRFANVRHVRVENEDRKFVRTTSFGGGREINSDTLAALSEKLISLRATAMETKDFAAVDALKSALMDAGVEVRMSKAGVELLPGAGFDATKLEGL